MDNGEPQTVPRKFVGDLQSSDADAQPTKSPDTIGRYPIIKILGTLVTETALVTVEPAGTKVGRVQVTTNVSTLPEAIAALAVSVKPTGGRKAAVKLSGSLAAGTMLKLLAVSVPVGVSKFSASVKTTPEAGSGPRLLRVIS
jgi:hypothetical protein